METMIIVEIIILIILILLCAACIWTLYLTICSNCNGSDIDTEIFDDESVSIHSDL